MYQVLYTDNARQDLEELFGYIALQSLENALSFADELKTHVEDTLTLFPHGGTLHNKAKGVRKHSYKGYTVFYHIPTESTVEVLHVVNLGKPLSARGIDL